MLVSILIAISLNFDTFSVTVVQGSHVLKPTIKNSIKIAMFFGIGQALMALIGSYLGLSFKEIIMNIDHWIAFILLSLIGGKLIIESKKVDKLNKKTDINNFKSLFLLVIATSIDALVVGITLSYISNSIFMDILTIAVVTFIASFIGYHSGNQLKKLLKNHIKVIGGLILIAIGIKILIQHLFFGG